MPRRAMAAWSLIPALAGVAGVTFAYVEWLQVRNPATVSTTFLLIVLVVAATSRLWVAVVTSVAAMLSFNFFFLPPVHTFTIADPQNWVALIAFLAVSLVASNLSATARSRAAEALSRRDELARLFDLSRDVLMMTESRDGIASLVRAMERRFDLSYVAIALPRATAWEILTSGPKPIVLEEQPLWTAYAAAKATLEFDAYARTYSGHRTMAVDGQTVHLVPLRAGTTPIGLLAAAGRPIEPGTLDALAGIAAIAIERADLLQERKTAELTRQSEQLKTTLLASLGHDLRTPLTAIRVAAGNVKDPSIAPEQRDEQCNVILAETERLTRLFQNILDMARIDAGAVTAERRWAHPSEIVQAARDQVDATLGDRLAVRIGEDIPVRLDPRLMASALARVLENAAQYSPGDAPIELEARVADEGLVVSVRDAGAGIPAGDLPHLFERFYRGEGAGARPSGTGMGLWIARSLLAAQGGRIWAENVPGGGARFTMVVPAAVREAVPSGEDVDA